MLSNILVAVNLWHLLTDAHDMIYVDLVQVLVEQLIMFMFGRSTRSRWMSALFWEIRT